MKWLHLSDIHMSQTVTGTDTRLLQKQLLDYLRQEIGAVDLLLLSGDYRYCGQPESPDKVWEWIRQTADAVGVRDLAQQVFMVPGNHDVTRGRARSYLVDGARKHYDAACGRLEAGVLEYLLGGFSYYNRLYQKIYKKDYIKEAIAADNPHKLKKFKDFSLVMLNTALLSNEDTERGNLLVGTDYVAELDPSARMVMVLAHHGLELLRPEEQLKLREIFKGWGTVLYLCGDAHMLLGGQTGDRLWQVTGGCLQGSRGTDIAFTAGEISGLAIQVTAHEWRGNWTIAPHFGDRGILEIGKWEWDRLERVEPALKLHIQKGIQEYQQRDIPIHTPQILLLLLTYPGSVLLRTLNISFTQDGRVYGVYLREQLESVNVQYSKGDFHFHLDFDLIGLLNLESAERLRRQKRFPYITENLLSYAVLDGKDSGTIQRIRETLGPAEFEDIKDKILWRSTPIINAL